MAHFTRPVELVHQKLNELRTGWSDMSEQSKRKAVDKSANELHRWIDYTNGEDGEVAIPVDVLAEVAFTLAPEIMGRDDMDYFLPEHAEPEDVPPIQSLRESISEVDTIDGDRGWGVVFQGPTQVPTSYKVASATHWQPAEYDTEWHDLIWSLEYYPTDDNGFGSVQFRVEA